MTAPNLGPIQDDTGQPTRPWRQWINNVALAADAVQQSGTTAQRTAGVLINIPVEKDPLD